MELDAYHLAGFGLVILGVGILVGVAVRDALARRALTDARAADAAREAAATETAFDDGARAMYRLLTPRPYAGTLPPAPLAAARAYRGTRPELFDQDDHKETPDA